MLTVTVNPSRDSGLAAADVTVDLAPDATVGDLAVALGEHLSGGRHAGLVAPVDSGRPWPARRTLRECGIRTGDVLDVARVPADWADRPAAPARRRAVLRVLTGPDAGRSLAVTQQTVTVGRDPACTLSLSDPLVSRRHATLVLAGAPAAAGGVTVTDDGSAHGTLVDGAAISRPTRVDWGRAVRLGDTVLVVEADSAAAEAHETGDAVLRPPRFGEPLAIGRVPVPAPPARPRPQPLQWAMFAMPLVFGGAFFLQTRSPYSIAYIAGYPVVMLLGWWAQRRRARKDHAKELAAWRADVDDVLADLDRAGTAQRLRTQDDHPELRTVAARVQLRHSALWTRRPGGPDFLSCRVGTGPVPALLAGDLKDGGGDREAAATAADDLAVRRTLDGLAVPVALADTPVLAVTGPADQVDGAVRAFVARLAADHSPADLTFAAVLGRDRLAHESWLRWLPHTTRRPSGRSPVAVGAQDGAALLDGLAAEGTDGEGAGGTARGVTLCLVDEAAGLPRRLVEATAAGAQVAAGRLRLVWLGSGPQTVPASTTTLLDLQAGIPAPDAQRAAARPGREQPQPVAVLAGRDRGRVQLLTDVDRAELEDVWRLARSMAACTDEVAVIPADTALPDVARLPELVPDLEHPDDAVGIRARWAARRGLRAQIGRGAGGVVTLDLREDGPHGLVAGTTGSGKSELLQTLICSLALNNPPSRITFLLVDYKGGAAFRECADLPHTVGYITDLSPSLVQRALTSLHAEVTAREQLLARYGAKDLRALEETHPDVAPPSLLICVDEFAALANEVPQFVDGVVNIAQRGRSLGMHLMLATQRPAGVVTAHVRANTDLRIALRVASTDDSQDVIDCADAARISRRTPGRAWIRRTGHGSAELVQAGWVGAREPLAGATAPVQLAPFTALAGDGPHVGPALDPRTDLDRLVTAVRAAFDDAVLAGIESAPKRPWLPELDGDVTLTATGLGALALATGNGTGADTGATGPNRPGEVPLGVLDRPAAQAQGSVALDYARAGHVLVFGASGSGKTELLRTVAVSAAVTDPVPPAIYGIDLAGGGLANLTALPVVGAVVGEAEFERILRLVRMLRSAVADRNRLLASRDVADIAGLTALGITLPRIHVLIDNLPALLDAFEAGGAIRRQHGEMLATVLQDGRRVGVHVTATAPRRTGVPSGVQAAFGRRIVLRMPADDDYAMLGAPPRVLDADTPPGRGLLGRHEVQVAQIGGAGTPLQAERLAGFAALLADVPPAVRVPGMPSALPESALPQPQRDTLAVAVDADLVTAVSLPLAAAPLLVAGRAGSGRSSLLAGIGRLARRSSEPPSEIVVVGPRAGGPQAAAHGADRVITDPAAVASWVDEWLAAAPMTGWRLVLVDDAHTWEREWEKGGIVREAVTALARLVQAAVGGRDAIVVVTDSDDARTRGHVPGAVQVARRARAGILLQPELSDGSVLGTSVPSHTVESLTGRGRGLLFDGATNRVVQVICAGHNDTNASNGSPASSVASQADDAGGNG